MLSDKILDFYMELLDETISYSKDHSVGTLLAFNNVFVSYLQEAGVTNLADCEIVNFKKTADKIRLDGYSYSDYFHSLTLLISDFNQKPKIEKLGKTDIDKILKQAVKFYRSCKTEYFEESEESGEGYKAYEYIKQYSEETEVVNIILITNNEAVLYVPKDMVVGKTTIKFDVWDIERLYQCLFQNVQAAQIVIRLKSKYSKPLHLIKVADENPAYDCSRSVYQENDDINMELDKNQTKSHFDLSGFQVVRSQFFSTKRDAALTISHNNLSFNIACLKKFKHVEYVELLFNSVEKCMAIRPCEKNNPNAIKWGTIRNGKWVVLPKSCKGFAQPLFQLMEWNSDCKYRFRAQFQKMYDEQVLIFELGEPEIIKIEAADINDQENNDIDAVCDEQKETTSVDYKDSSKQRKTNKILYPTAWANSFGNREDNVVWLQRVKYCGDWDVLRPAKTVEGVQQEFAAELLDEMLNEDQELIDKMRCAV